MKCPRCTENTPDFWRPGMWSGGGVGFKPVLTQAGREFEAADGKITRLPDSQIQLDWMTCANPECEQVVVRLHEGFQIPGHEEITTTWLVYPRMAQRAIDPLVQGAVRKDYMEAAAIIDLSPRMSAVMSRRILADLLKTHAKQEQFGLQDRIDGFIQDTHHPSGLRQSLHHFREAANFGAHTQTDDQGQIIDIGREEAEWTLDLIDRLFDYFIVAPEKDRQMQTAMEEKMKAAGRKPIKPLPDSTETS